MGMVDIVVLVSLDVECYILGSFFWDNGLLVVYGYELYLEDFYLEKYKYLYEVICNVFD